MRIISQSEYVFAASSFAPRRRGETNEMESVMLLIKRGKNRSVCTTNTDIEEGGRVPHNSPAAQVVPQRVPPVFQSGCPTISRAPPAADTTSTVQRTLTNYREPFGPEKQLAIWLR